MTLPLATTRNQCSTEIFVSFRCRRPRRSESAIERLIVLATVIGIALASQAAAGERAMALPEITVNTPRTAERSSDRCVDVEIGSSRSFDCLNQKFKQQVDRTNPSMNIPPVDARSTDIHTGVVNMPAVQQQYGKNFGHSAMPYRPAAPVFTSPLGHR